MWQKTRPQHSILQDGDHFVGSCWIALYPDAGWPPHRGICGRVYSTLILCPGVILYWRRFSGLGSTTILLIGYPPQLTHIMLQCGSFLTAGNVKETVRPELFVGYSSPLPSAASARPSKALWSAHSSAGPTRARSTKQPPRPWSSPYFPLGNFFGGCSRAPEAVTPWPPEPPDPPWPPESLTSRAPTLILYFIQHWIILHFNFSIRKWLFYPIFVYILSALYLCL